MLPQRTPTASTPLLPLSAPLDVLIRIAVALDHWHPPEDGCAEPPIADGAHSTTVSRSTGIRSTCPMCSSNSCGVNQCDR